ncbi:uncharacterized protein MONOS_17065 [Monocercomonoides exilis]|uniref:uncharacterized protein n=1 Tax=Monocercomonoides exilis TaxID=2049356 RepID=UPI00355A8FF5|nr:hypothetical protein MONOS_17065 [Monocercomonoides exilis]
MFSSSTTSFFVEKLQNERTIPQLKLTNIVPDGLTKRSTRNQIDQKRNDDIVQSLQKVPALEKQRKETEVVHQRSPYHGDQQTEDRSQAQSLSFSSQSTKKDYPESNFKMPTFSTTAADKYKDTKSKQTTASAHNQDHLLQTKQLSPSMPQNADSQKSSFQTSPQMKSSMDRFF